MAHLWNCPDCGLDRLEYIATIDGQDCYRCAACDARLAEKHRETFGEWADKRLEHRITEGIKRAAKCGPVRSCG